MPLEHSAQVIPQLRLVSALLCLPSKVMMCASFTSKSVCHLAILRAVNACHTSAGPGREELGQSGSSWNWPAAVLCGCCSCRRELAHVHKNLVEEPVQPHGLPCLSIFSRSSNARFAYRARADLESLCISHGTYCLVLVRPPGDLATSGGPGLIRSNPGHLLAWPQNRLRRHAQALGALCVIDLY